MTVPRIPEHIDADDLDALARWVEADDSDPGPHIDGAPLREVAAAAHALDKARRQLGEAARAAHDSGLSWTVIGATLGISRQAARERFATPTRA